MSENNVENDEGGYKVIENVVVKPAHVLYELPSDVTTVSYDPTRKMLLISGTGFIASINTTEI